MIGLRFKKGVSIKGIRPEALAMIPTVLARFEQCGADHCVITSGLDGTHSRNSLHYKGLALDWRTRHLDEGKAEAVAKLIRQDLGDQYDVVLEKTHLHIEFDPD